MSTSEKPSLREGEDQMITKDPRGDGRFAQCERAWTAQRWADALALSRDGEDVLTAADGVVTGARVDEHRESRR
jgi:hypothetical protein